MYLALNQQMEYDMLINSRHSICTITAFSCLAFTVSFNVSAKDNSENKGWYVKPVIGTSFLSNTKGVVSDTGLIDGNADIDLSTGFVAGLATGYRYNDEITAEIHWEYRTNDSDTTTASGDVFEGNYASSIIYLNGYYHFWQRDAWQAYAGAGLGWVQEIDIDIEDNGVERSFSGDGDIATQFMVGLDYRLNDQWDFNTELRYTTLSSIDLDGEENISGTFNDLDYDPVSITVGFKYRF